MKILLLALIISACGKYETKTNPLGLQRAYNPLVVNGLEKDKLVNLCGILKQKAGLMPQVLNSSYTFGFSQKNCDDPAVGVESNVDVTIQRPFSNFLFKRKFDNQDFFFSDVETDTSGTMGTICPGLDSLTSPMKLANGSVRDITTTNISGADCASTADEQCVLIQTGAFVGTTNDYKIHTREWIKFRTNRNFNNLGFFSERKVITTALCGGEKYTETHAVLR